MLYNCAVYVYFHKVNLSLLSRNIHSHRWFPAERWTGIYNIGTYIYLHRYIVSLYTVRLCNRYSLPKNFPDWFFFLVNYTNIGIGTYCYILTFFDLRCTFPFESDKNAYTGSSIPFHIDQNTIDLLLIKYRLRLEPKPLIADNIR